LSNESFEGATVTLEEWLHEQMDLLQMFAMWCRTNQRLAPEWFPARLTPEQWDELAQAFDPDQADADFGGESLGWRSPSRAMLYSGVNEAAVAESPCPLAP
jgi:hypothetical protein